MKLCRTHLKNNLPAVSAPFDLQRFQNSSKYFRYSSSFFNRFGANVIRNAMKVIFEMGSDFIISKNGLNAHFF
jgi:hypothetical protein